MIFLFNTESNRTPQASINRNPPIGVRNPIVLKSNAVMLFVASKYMDPENKETPERTR